MTVGGSSQTGRTCHKCGNVMPQAAKFCGIDGSALDISSAKSEPQARDEVLATKENQQRQCPKCLRLYPLRATFCGSDGNELLVAKQETANPDTLVTTFASKQDLIEPKDTLIGTTLDNKYKIESLIAEGGMANLYRAHQLGMDRAVAIKVMCPKVAPSSQAVERFEQECKLAAKLNHPNIVSVYDVGFVKPNEPYLVMEFIDGQALSDELVQKGPPPPTVAISIIIQILRGLEEAHGLGIIHRDLKADNILLQRKTQRSDWVKIVDFGIASLAESSKRFTKAGIFIGTPVYMAPEQFKSRPLDVRQDLYAIGIVLFELLTGEVPFDGESPEVIMMKHLMEEPPELSKLRPDIPSELGVIIKKALQKDPEQRFQTAAEFREALESCIDGLDENS